MNMEEHRRNSSYGKSMNSLIQEDMIQDTIIQEAIQDFHVYMQYAPNRRKAYVNGSTTPVEGVMTDVSDVNLLGDTKWFMTPLNVEVFVGDILVINNQVWLCTQSTEKTTQNCNKVKITACNYQLKFPFYSDKKEAQIYTADVIYSTFLSDTRDFKQPFPQESGTTYLTLPYNAITKKVERQSRLWLYDGAFQLTGIDYTGVNYYNGHGVIKWTVKPSLDISDLDRIDLGICDYYKYFDLPTTSTDVNSSGSGLNVIVSSNTTTAKGRITFDAQGMLSGQSVKFEFVGDSMGCKLIDVTTKGCILQAGTDIGIVKVKCYSSSNKDLYQIIRIVIQN
jgi:hypothetical protein